MVDFGAQYAQLIARRVRELHVYSEIVPNRISAAEIAERAPKAIILSGGPASVHVEGAPQLDAAIYDLGIPILGICYGAQLIAQQLGGVVGRGMAGEYGRTLLERTGDSSILPDDAPHSHECWMSHFDGITELPDGFVATATSPGAPVAAAAAAPVRRAGASLPGCTSSALRAAFPRGWVARCPPRLYAVRSRLTAVTRRARG